MTHDDRPPIHADTASGPGSSPGGKPPRVESVAEEDETAIEEAARERFGLQVWDRPALYRETAAAATDADLAFWLVLLLSGAIASLGLALNATAVVIGAMLIAPLLGPVLGLAMALAVGDGRLAVQTGLIIFLGMVGVIAVGAILTLLLPFQTVTEEILARTRPTTLDLAIAVASGLAGAVVMLSREKRLSASIPGVAIAVALIPPLGVSGFGIGVERWDLVKGSLLLFGANLGGIVLSGMLAFLLIGMHREGVVEAARRWHREGERGGLAEWLEQSNGFRHLRVFDAAWARVGLVFTFCVAVGVPLSTSLQAVVREARVEGAVAKAAATFEEQDRLFVLGRDVRIGENATTVRLRVATAEWVGADRRQRFERDATAAAGEVVQLELEQVPVETEQLRDIASNPAAPLNAAPAPPQTPAALLDRLDAEFAAALGAVALPDSVAILSADLRLGSGALGSGVPGIDVRYAAQAALPAEAEAMLARQAASRLGVDPARVDAVPVILGPRTLPLAPAQLDTLGALLLRFPHLRATVAADSAAGAETRQAFARLGIPEAQVLVRRARPPGRLVLALADSARAAPAGER